jgi:hypothetical protein
MQRIAPYPLPMVTISITAEAYEAIRSPLPQEPPGRDETQWRSRGMA